MLVKKSKSEWLPFVTVATAVYLIVEFAFNARLLDVIGGVPTTAQLNDIEKYGRTISGFAVALVFWGWLIECSRSKITGRIIWGQALFLLTCVTALVVPSVAHLESKLVDYLVESSTPEVRRTSAIVVMLQKTFASGRLTMSGFDLPANRLGDPDGKAFLALYSPLVARVPGLSEKFEGIGTAVALEFSDIRYGGADVNTKAFSSVLRGVESGYNNFFKEASERYNASFSDIRKRQQSAWSDYTSRLKANRLTPNSRMSARTRKKIVSMVQQRGIPVANNWRPSDRASFNRAVEQRVRRDAQTAFRNGVSHHLGSKVGDDVKPGMSMAAFLKTGSVQATLRNRLHLPKGDYTVVSGSTLEEMEHYYKHTTYPKVLQISARDIQKQLVLDVGQFRDGAQGAAFGKDFVRAMLVPSIALVLSVLGALVHVWKLTFFVLQLTTGRTCKTAWHKFVAIMVLSLGTLFVFSRVPSTDITSQDLYLYFKEQVANQTTMSAESVLAIGVMYFSDGVIHAQPVLYPVFEWTRLHLMKSFDFGYGG